MPFAYCLAFLSAFTVSAVACLLVRRLAPRLGLVDKPGERKIHAAPFPTGGGLGIGLGVFVPFAIGQLFLFLVLQQDGLRALVPEAISVHLEGLWQKTDQLWILLGLGGVLLVLGTLDDRFGLNWKLRLGVQTAVAVAAVLCGWRFSLYIEAPILTGALSVVWIVALINSFNMLDNMNGLSAGVAAICASFLAAVMFLMPNPASQQPQLFIAGFLVVLVGAIAGFLLYNNPFRASMFMGDGGAYLVGFFLSCSTLGATFSDRLVAPQTMFVPLLILAIPLYDLATVLSIRFHNGKSPFVGDKNHFSHRLVDLGMSRTLAVLVVYLATAICCLGSLLLYKVGFLGSVLIFAQTLLVLLLVGILEYAGRGKDSR